jgi:2',3'-cyclic-nucleotide 2'-phosphodiesterase (5'-nucleotidase family)
MMLLFAALCTSVTPIFSQMDTITILHINDTHSNLAPTGPGINNVKDSTGGIARAATLIGMTRMTNPNVLLLHAGDVCIGDLFYNVYFGVPELQMMAALGIRRTLTAAFIYAAWNRGHLFQLKNWYY